jgi:ATP-dependent 26S proteasome regulatory subunit
MFLVFAICRFSQQNTGVLLHGPPGTGKTSLARLSAHDAGVNFFSIGPEIVTQYEENEKALHEVFDSALQAAPAVVRYFVKRMCFSVFIFCVQMNNLCS